MANMLSTSAFVILESSLNKLIATDTVSIAALAKLSGKVIEFKVTDAPIHCFVIPCEHGIELQQQYLHNADTTLEGSLAHFKALVLSDNSSENFFGNGITISGDSQLAAAFQRIIGNANIDWQGIVANLSGDLVAAEFATIFNRSQAQFSTAKNSLELNVVEYLQEESRILPSPVEIEILFEGIADTRSAADRLEARLNLLSKKISSQNDM